MTYAEFYDKTTQEILNFVKKGNYSCITLHDKDPSENFLLGIFLEHIDDQGWIKRVGDNTPNSHDPYKFYVTGKFLSTYYV